MSKQTSASTSSHPPSSTSFSVSKTSDYKEGFRMLDQRLARLAEDGLPTTPYILTVPSDKPYNVGSGQKSNWMTDSPFEAHEEQYQYVSFLYRDPVDSLFVPRAEFEEQKSKDSALKLTNGILSGTSTPLHSSGQKKKISLDAYKNKTKAVSQATTPSRQDNAAAVEQNPTIKANSRLRMTREISVETKTKLASPPHTDNCGRKRALDDAFDGGTADIDSQSHHHSPPKISRLTPPTTQVSSLSNSIASLKQESKSSNSDEQHPARKDSASAPQGKHSTENAVDVLPPLYITSPPPSDGTAKLPALLPSSVHMTSLKGKVSNFATLSTPVVETGKPSLLGLPGDDEVVKAGNLPPLHKIHSGKADEEKNLSPNLDSEKGSKDEIPHTPSSKATTVNGHSDSGTRILSTKMSKVVKLRFSKNSRHSLQRLLKMKQSPIRAAEMNAQVRKDLQPTSSSAEADPSRRDKPSSAAPNKHHEASPKISKNDLVRSDARTAEKRHREEDTEQETPPKRRKASENTDSLKAPHTPTSARTRSPGPSSQTGSHKHETPKKDPRSNAVPSVNNMMTPQGSVATPNAFESFENLAVGALEHVIAGDATAQDWAQESRRLTTLAREIKHISQNTANSRKATKAKDEAAHLGNIGAVQGMECLLCFILGFSANDRACAIQRKPAPVTSTWKALIPVCHSVRMSCQGLPHLKAFCLMIEGFCRARIAAIKAEKHAVDAAASLIAKEELEELLDSVNESRMLGIRAEELLSNTALADHYPRAYDHRPSMPIALMSKPGPLVSMTRAFLEEWCSQNNVPWEEQFEIGLSKDL